MRERVRFAETKGVRIIQISGQDTRSWCCPWCPHDRVGPCVMSHSFTDPLLSWTVLATPQIRHWSV